MTSPKKPDSPQSGHTRLYSFREICRMTEEEWRTICDAATGPEKGVTRES